MPTLYGEGEGASRRLQEEIMRRIPDQSLFAWLNVYTLPETLQEQDAILGCETTEQPGHLLGTFCSILSSESNVHFLYGGTVNVYQGPALAPLQARLFPLSLATLERCRPHIQAKTIHVSHRGRTTGALETARDWRHTDLHLVLPTEQQVALRAQHYTVDLQILDWNRPRIHVLTLSHDEHKYYRHRADPAVQVHWADFKPWNMSLRLNERSVTLTAAGAQLLVVKLGLDFAGPSCYRLRVDVLH
ncbi:hypothetical protein LXA43DRAFT_1090704 [Ganoderma leucocontextum]|nr:hypothetical protein LXA43DRAFT_1090704 [Ganoderma leucocontextum]